MTERPILFSAPMVCAILDGNKTQTRRALRQQPEYPILIATDPRTNRYQIGEREPMTQAGLLRECPYGQSGDRLWVRETWYCDDYRVQSGPYAQVDGARELLAYRADGDRPYEADQPVWKPSIHMPRWASRILLEIVSVRVERLAGICESDARAEGCAASGWQPSYSNPDNARGDESTSAKDAFADLWESINDAGSWDAKPWVWVIEFKRVTP